jgi:sulfoxide reductase heme-binding subunit YedZ
MAQRGDVDAGGGDRTHPPRAEGAGVAPDVIPTARPHRGSAAVANAAATSTPRAAAAAAAPVRMPSKRTLTVAKVVVFALCLLPFAWLAWAAVRGTLGPDPVAQLTHETGIWALRLLLATLAMTPLRRLTGSPLPIRFRRMLGLFAFFYAAVHLAIYLVLDLRGYWPQVFEDIVKRPFITVGAAALLLLLPLALTSTRTMMRRLGRNWGRLHMLVYPAAILACLHFIWLVKADLREPLIYAGILAVLLAWRLPGWFRRSA